MNRRRLMLISNSFCFGKRYLEHCQDALLAFLGDIRELVFVPYALADYVRYAAITREGFDRMGVTITCLHEVGGDVSLIDEAKAIFVGGGNTFRLLNTLQQSHVLGNIRQAVDRGALYLGASAGANVACPTIMTTNDMPIVWPPSCNALNLFPFQINPHYIDPDPSSTHMGETRDKRIAEFHEENDTTVIGLREGSWIVAENGVATRCGTTGAKLFVKGAEPREWDGGPIVLS